MDILILLSLAFSLVIFLIMITLFSLEDRKVKIRNESSLLQGKPPRLKIFGDRFCKYLASIKPPALMRKLVAENMYIQSGIQLPYEHFLSGWWLLSLLLALFFVLPIIFGKGDAIWNLSLAGFALVVLPGPYLYLQRKIRLRKREIDDSLANFLDSLTLMIEAGMGLIPGLRRIEGSFSGALRDEIKQVLIRIDLGYSRQEALREMGKRVPSSTLKQFVEAVILSERLGTSLAKIIRVQAKMLRARRWQRAEIQARTAPVRIIPALVFIFLPGLMLIYLAPPIITLLVLK